MNGKLFVIEGVDGSGKQTQSTLLYENLLARGKKIIKTSFPNYNSESSSLVKMYLNGEFGSNPQDVNAYASSIFFAVDRFATYKKTLQPYFEDGYIIIADRYTTSNMVHQASKIDDLSEKDQFLDWLTDLEFGKFAIPVPTQVFFLNINPSVSQILTQQRENKITHQKSKDIHESDINYLYKSYENSKYLIKKYNWEVIECTKGSVLMSIPEINKILMDRIYEYLN